METERRRRAVAATCDTNLAALRPCPATARQSHSQVSLERYSNNNAIATQFNFEMDNSDLMWPKSEIDSESDSPRREIRETRLQWSSENTRKLIEAFEKDCKELWDVKHPMVKDRRSRQTRLEYLADMFGTTSEEISRKIHNLRTQFNNELRKIKRRQAVAGCGEGIGVSGWEHFDALSFLMRETTGGDPLMDSMEGVNLELAEFQADEEEEFGLAARSRAAAAAAATKTLVPAHARTQLMRVAASAPPPLPDISHPLMWPEDAVPRLRPSLNADECQIFGDFVASELRTLRSDESRKRLKRMIQKAILQVGEEEDINIISS